jgi:hypothetical protein
MPSVDEIFTVSGVAVGSGVDVACGVDVISGVIGVSEDSGVGVSDTSVEVGERGVGTLWQAVSKKMMRSGIVFFIGFFVATSDSHFTSDCRLIIIIY